MARHLTPAERAAIVARYLETANAHQVAREFECSVHTVLRSVDRAGEARKDTLHARAIARGMREGRRALTETSKRLRAWLDAHGDPTAPTMEPGDVAKIASALRGVVAGVHECDEHRERKQLNRLTRELRRAEIELARLRIAAGGVEKHEHAVTVDLTAARADLAAVLAGSAGASDPGGEDGSGSPSR